mmetsp:Transcript_118888/g.341491  ORF Transcript_118888/g.341491 Transcript_118888/m.341491 type:complete len:239 (-) Transcript_118888:57-773(-)
MGRRHAPRRPRTSSFGVMDGLVDVVSRFSVRRLRQWLRRRCDEYDPRKPEYIIAATPKSVEQIRMAHVRDQISKLEAIIAKRQGEDDKVIDHYRHMLQEFRKQLRPTRVSFCPTEGAWHGGRGLQGDSGRSTPCPPPAAAKLSGSAAAKKSDGACVRTAPVGYGWGRCRILANGVVVRVAPGGRRGRWVSAIVGGTKKTHQPCADAATAAGICCERLRSFPEAPCNRGVAPRGASLPN